MKLDTNLRPQDKRTIAIVIYIGIVVLFGWYMIRPAAIKLGELDDRIRAAEAIKQEYRMKSMQIASAEVLYNKAVTDINDSTVKFYDVMDNSQIEKMGTSYILGYGLTPVDFMVDIRDGSYINEVPYLYSNIKILKPAKVTEGSTDKTKKKEVNLKDPAYLASLDVKSLQAYYLQAIADARNTESAEVQSANITIVVQGPQDKCQKLIDDITKKPSIRVTGFYWTDAKEIWVEDEKGNKTLMNPDYKELRVSLHFYMAAKPDFNK
ncbi:MAG: hypothetical protein J6Z43_10375 [Clostridiales bacterium]|nr:hypothetical protein [Clostridiales bacterium]